MNDIPNWALALVSIAGSTLGSFIAVRVAVTRLEVQMVAVMKDIVHINNWIDKHESVTQKGLAELAVLQAQQLMAERILREKQGER